MSEKKEEKKVKMGRPTENPRNKRLSLRISESEMNKIEECSEKLKETKIETVLKAIELLRKELNL